MRNPPLPQVAPVVPQPRPAVQPNVQPKAVNAPNLINFTGMPEGMGGNQYYGTGLSEIDQARDALALAAAGDMGLSQVREPFGGAAYMVNRLSNNIRQSQALGAERATREGLAQLMGGIDPTTGPTMQQVQQAYSIDPAFGEKLYAQLVASQNREQWVTDPDNPGLQMNTATGERKKMGLDEAGGPKLSDVNSFVGRITGMPSYKSYAQATPAWQTMQSAFTRDTPQADLSMVIALAKIYDPDSVVREGEVETVKKTGNLPNELYAQFLYLTGEQGARLAPEVRAGMLQEGYSKMKGFSDAWDRDRKYFLDQAARYGFDARDVPELGALGEQPAGPEPPAPDDTGGGGAEIPYPGDMPEGWTGSWPSRGWWATASPADRQTALDQIKAAQQKANPPRVVQ